MKLLGWLQVVGSVVFFSSLLLAILVNYTRGQLGLIFLTGTILAGLSLAAGVALLKGKRYGLWLSGLNQLLQLFSVSVSGVYAKYTVLGGVYLFVQSFANGSYQSGFMTIAMPGLRVGVGAPRDTFYLGLDLIALFFLILLVIEGTRRRW